MVLSEKDDKVTEVRRNPQRTGMARDNWDAQPFGPKKDELLALLGHELRGPLGAVRTALEVLRRSDDAATREEIQGLLERQTRQMDWLIEKLLQFSRVTQGKARLQKRPVTLAPMIASALETVRPLIDERGQFVEIALPQAAVTVEADATLLKQVLTNLLGNAAKYTDRGGRIWLTAEQAGDDIVLRVRDNGIGMTPEMLPRVFEPFWRSAPAAAYAQCGLGIGLALVRQVVAIHGGSVSAYSAGPGQGSEFVVRLPQTPGGAEKNI